MKKQDRLKAMASKYFEDHPKAEAYHLFEDGMGFGDHAKAHKEQYAKRTNIQCTTYRSKDFLPVVAEEKKNKPSESKS